MSDELSFKVSAMNISQASETVAAVTKEKYAIDESLFDMLVDKASSNAPNDITDDTPESMETERALKQRLLDPTTDDLEYLAKLLVNRLDEGQGEIMLEVGGCEGEFSMDLLDSDVFAITVALGKAAELSSVDAFVQLLHDSGAAAGSPSMAAGSIVGGGQKAAVRYARDITVASGPSSQKKGKAKGQASEATSTAPPSSHQPQQQQVRTAYYLVRRKPSGVEHMLEVRVAVVGNVDAGKSTMLGVLTQGHLDDGRGKARVALFRHQHELDSGRTSSVGLEILGFDKISGAPVRHTTDNHRRLGWDAVCRRSSKLVSFLDLAGHEKYLKTTVFGMAGGAPDFVMLMVAANAGLTGMAREHLGLALALNIPVFVIITKIDMCPPNVLDATLKELTRVLRSSGCRKIPIAVKDRASVVMAASKCINQRVCPVFQISNVTGEGVDCLQTFLNILPINCEYAAHSLANDDSGTDISGQTRKTRNAKSGDAQDAAAVPGVQLHFDINEVFAVPFVGTVVSGIVTRGTMRPNDNVWIGPDFNGNCSSAVIKTVHRKRVEVQTAYAGQSVSMVLKKVVRSQVRKGMVLLGKLASGGAEMACPQQLSRTFEAEIVVLYHSTTITKKYQAMVHCGSVRQTARVLSIEHADSNNESLLRTGDRARVVFQFIRHPEFIAADSRLIFREGRTKGLGKVLRMLDKAEERNAVFKATDGTMAFDQRSIKAHREAMRHKNAQAVASGSDKKKKKRSAAAAASASASAAASNNSTASAPKISAS
ncbi:hypothetical protein LPJ66_004727 [Kickxella alabastrina]|uniref:Uncharacterized protein n=1 Tax=Kickxella alabastrina TaxID=61397 RepID=A0ACC1IKG7_9FUNG|nr:hypothetical protein LPJ66_004727 [Kickxella alabastrina]